MSNPQQPELARSRKTPSQDQDAVAGVIDGQSTPSTEGRTGPVPAENQPGHRPEKEQDKPDLDAFAAKLGVSDQPADEVVDRQIERQAQPLPPPRPAHDPGGARKPALSRVPVAVLALVGGLIFAQRRRKRAAGRP